MFKVKVKTKLGVFGLIGTEKGLGEVLLPGACHDMGAKFSTDLTQAYWFESTAQALQSYGEIDFNLWQQKVLEIPLDLPGIPQLRSTDFTRAVWEGIAQIPLGKVWTYKELAEYIGNPKAVRAVGSACGKNPIPLIVPCHRVVAANGWGGFSGGTLEVKKMLLRHELGAENPQLLEL